MNARSPSAWVIMGCLTSAGVFLSVGEVSAAEWHVRTNGSDRATGTAAEPLRTIQAAALLAQPGDTVTVHGGTYRERINPPRGGESPDRRITYQSAVGERVEVKGSEVVTNWTKLARGVWKAELPNTFFGAFNPFADVIHGDWFDPRGRVHHTGAVYRNGDWLTEAAALEEVAASAGSPAPRWFGQVDATTTTLWAQFGDAEPAPGEVEVHARRTVFYPDQPGRNFITVRGFVLSQAATPWAPPTAEQVGLIGTHWSQGWVIESNVVRYSTCSGISLGKHGDTFDNTSADTAEGYVKTIERAFQRGWTRERIGHHVVHGNEVSHCEQAGIVGSLGAAFCTVTDNHIHDIHVRRLFSGAEMAGIKFHAAIDTVIRGNYLHHTVRGLWLDWMAQGTRVSGNVFHDNAAEDLFVEVDHGPFVVDHNLFLSGTSLLDVSEGGAYAHNLFSGRLVSAPEPNRQTPFHPPHQTALAGLVNIQGGDNRFLNNLFLGNGPVGTNGLAKNESRNAGHAAGYGLWVYDERPLPHFTAGNVYLNGARPHARETKPVVIEGTLAPGKWTAVDGLGRFEWVIPSRARDAETVLVTTALLGRAKIPGAAYENADGSPLVLDVDILGRKRAASRTAPGPFEDLAAGGWTWNRR